MLLGVAATQWGTYHNKKCSCAENALSCRPIPAKCEGGGNSSHPLTKFEPADGDGEIRKEIILMKDMMSKTMKDMMSKTYSIMNRLIILSG